MGAVQRAVHELLRLGQNGESGNAGAAAGLEDISPSGEQAGFASLRRRPVPPQQREALGKSLREKVSLRSLGEWSAGTGRRDPVAQLEDLHRGRLEQLVPVRVGRMAASPYGFLRGSAVVMAADLAQLPATGIMPVICGDAHVGNFGFYASPERDLVLDLNDFDEAHPGCWEWDVRRLSASIWVAGRQAGRREDHCEEATVSCASAYQKHLRELASQPLLARTFDRIEVDGLANGDNGKPLQKVIRKTARKARHRTSATALPRFTTENGGTRQITEEPPLISRLHQPAADQLAQDLDDYIRTLPPQWQRVVGGYSIGDIALKVVGLGSVGLRAFIVLCEGVGPDDVLFLQVKEAQRSVIAPYVHGDTAWHDHQGQRVVEYQQTLQAVSDPLLGWTTYKKRPYYVRQFRDMKGRVDLGDMKASALTGYTAICGRLLAKAHARTAGASLIAGYLGKSSAFPEAMSRFGRAYADQTEQDHQRLTRAVAQGLLPAEMGT